MDNHPAEHRHCEERSDEAIQHRPLNAEGCDGNPLLLQQLREHVADGTGLLRRCAPRNDGAFAK